MLRNYLIVAWRNLLRQKLYSLINILGLAVGMACCILILQFVRYELASERQHTKADRIYQVLRETQRTDGKSDFTACLSGPLGPTMEEEIPEVERAARFWRFDVALRYDERHLETSLAIVDPAFFDVFDFPMVGGGDPVEALRQPASILLTRRHVERIFGDEDPIGKTVSIHSSLTVGDYIVAGVLEDFGPNTSIGFHFITTNLPTDLFYTTLWTDWLNSSWRMTQILAVLRSDADVGAVETKLHRLMEKYLGPETSQTERYRLQALTRIRHYSHIDFGIPSWRSIEQIYMLMAIAGLVVLIACVNFINLSTARSVRRSREVGIRKVFGGHRGQLIRQFVSEAIMMALLGGVIALGFAELMLPSFNNLIGLQLTLGFEIVPWVIGLSIVVGLLAGCYPAFYLSGFQPVGALRGGTGSVRKDLLRKGLVVFQFAVSILLIMGTMTIYRQLDYITEQNLGYDADGMVSLAMLSGLRDRSEAVKAEFASHPNVISATTMTWQNFLIPRRVTVARDDRVEALPFLNFETDANFLTTYRIDLKAGRDFHFKENRDLSKGKNEFLINEAAVRALGWEENPLGRQLRFSEADMERVYGKKEITGTVVGVVEDFHYQSAHHQIEPLLINQSYWVSQLHLRIRSTQIGETLAFFRKTWQKFVPDMVFAYRFLDEELASAYRAERQTAFLSFIASGLAIFVACLGLIGLAAFAAEQRSKEIGIRKVLGASVSSIVQLLSGEFLRLVVLANLIAWLFGYFIARKWLDSFVYRIELGIDIFVLGGLLGFALALATVLYQTIKAAMANPVQALMNE